MTEVTSPAVSADGDLMACLSNETGLDQIWLYPMSGGRVTGPGRQITDLPERVVSLSFAPKGRDLIYSTDCGMDERHQLWLIPDAAQDAHALTAKPGRVHVWGCWSPEADRIAFASNERDPRQMDVHVMTLANRARECVWQGGGYAEPLAFAADGRLLIRDSRRSMRDQDLLWVDLETGAVAPALPHNSPAQYLSVKLDADAKGGVVLTDQDSDLPRPCRADFVARTLTPVYEPADCEVEKVVLTSARDRMACIVNRAGMNVVDLVNLTDGTVTELGAPAKGVLDSLNFAANDTRLLCSFAAPDQPAAIWGWSHDTGFERLSAETLGYIRTGFCAPEIQRFDSFDGLSVPYFLYVPPGERPKDGWPVLFLVHGGPEMQWKARFRADLLHYLQSGIMLVAPNVRGSSGYGRRYCAADDREKRMDSVRDLIALRDHIALRPDTDAARIAVSGQSYGGFMVLAAMTEAPEKWRCGVDIYGVSNFTTLMMTTGPWRQVLRAAEYGDPVEDAALLREISPMRRVDRIAAPLLIVHATDDPRVPIEQSEQVLSALRGLDKPVEYLRIEHEGHGFSRRTNRTRVFETMADFLARHL